MESGKVAIFLLFFVAFLIAARRLFSRSNPSYSSDYLAVPDPLSPNPDERSPAVVGSDLPFPIVLPPLQQRPDGSYNRPKILNYYFSNLDLKAGPLNPRSFCDQLFVEFESPATGARWTNEFTVATPFGLQDLLDQTGQNLCFDGTLVIVPRWDMALILRTVLDEVMDKYAHTDVEEMDGSA